MNSPDIILAVDWSKNLPGRSVYEADVFNRVIKRLDYDSWTLARVLDIAHEHQRRSKSVLVSMDLVFGVPENYWQEAQQVRRWAHTCNFVDWLRLLVNEESFWQTVAHADSWDVEHPFFAVPGGKGSLNAYHHKAGYPLLRDVDRRCRAKPCFCVSGIPGTVGSGTRDLWQELAPLLAGPHSFSIWPFEGSIDQLLADSHIVLAEGYPAIAYTPALEAELPSAMHRIGKTKRPHRQLALERLTETPWVTEGDVTLHGCDEALESEDDFDALMSAAGSLRCRLSHFPLEAPDIDRIAEGGILLTPAIDFALNSKVQVNRVRKRTPKSSADGVQRLCPIQACSKVFKRGRLGWDSHVASLKTHLEWLPNVTDPEERKRQFREQFATWWND